MSCDRYVSYDDAPAYAPVNGGKGYFHGDNGRVGHDDYEDDSATTYSNGSPSDCRDDEMTQAAYRVSRVSEARHSAQRVLEEAARESEEMLQRQKQRKNLVTYSPGQKHAPPLSTRSSKEPLYYKPRTPRAQSSPSAHSESGMRHSKHYDDQQEKSLSLKMENVRLQNSHHQNDELRQQIDAMEVLLKDKETDWKKKVKNLESRLIEMCKDKQSLKVTFEKELESKSESLKEEVERLKSEALKVQSENKQSTLKFQNQLEKMGSELGSLKSALQEKNTIIESLQEEKRNVTDSARAMMDEARQEIERLKDVKSEETEHLVKSLEFEFNRKMQRFEEDADQMEMDIREKTGIIAELQREITRLKRACRDGEEANVDMQGKMEALTKELKSAQDKVTDAEAEASKMKAKAQNLEEEMKKINDEKNLAQQNISMIEKKVQELKDELSAVKNDLNKSLVARERLEAKVTSVEEEKTKLQRERQQSTEQITQLQAKLEKARDEVSTVREEAKSSLEKKDREIRDLSESLQFQKEKSLELKSDMKNMMREMENEVCNLENALQQKTRAVSEATDKAKANEIELVQLRADLQKLTQQNTAMEHDLQDLQGALDRNREKAAYAEELEDELKGMNANLSCLNREVVSLNEEKQRLVSELIDERREISALKGEFSTMEQNLKVSRARNVEDEQKIRRLFENNDNLQVTNDKMVDEVNSLKASLANAEKRLSSIPQLERLLAEAEQEANKYRRECDATRAENIATVRELKAELAEVQKAYDELQDATESDRKRSARNESLVAEMQDEINDRDDHIKELETRIEIEKRSSANLARDVKELSMQLEESAEANRLEKQALVNESRENERQFEEQERYVEKLLKEIENFKEERTDMQREIRLLREDLVRLEQQQRNPSPRHYQQQSLVSPRSRMSQSQSRTAADRDYYSAANDNNSRFAAGGGGGSRFGTSIAGTRSVAPSMSRPGFVDSTRSAAYDVDTRHELASPSTYGGRGSRNFRY